MNDEDFASAYRQDNIFGPGGDPDYFEEEAVAFGDASESSFSDNPNASFDSSQPSMSSPSPQPLQHQQQQQQQQQQQPPLMEVSKMATHPNGGNGAVSLLFLVAGAGLGYHFRGPLGALGGALVGGAARNFTRLARSSRTNSAVPIDSARQGLVGLLGLSGGSYLLYKSKNK